MTRNPEVMQQVKATLAELVKRAPHVEIIEINTPSGFSKTSPNNEFMVSIVRKARALAVSGDTILLAPACASMDQFESYADRGDRFASAVKAVIENV